MSQVKVVSTSVRLPKKLLERVNPAVEICGRCAK